MTYEPVTTMADIERNAKQVEALSDQLAGAIRDAAEAEAAYEQAFETELLKVYHTNKGGKMPAEDIRKALAHEQVPAGVYAAHLVAKANLQALEKRLRGLAAAMSARQSLLRAGGQ